MVQGLCGEVWGGKGLGWLLGFGVVLMSGCARDSVKRLGDDWVGDGGIKGRLRVYGVVV